MAAKTYEKGGVPKPKLPQPPKPLAAFEAILRNGRFWFCSKSETKIETSLPGFGLGFGFLGKVLSRNRDFEFGRRLQLQKF